MSQRTMDGETGKCPEGKQLYFRVDYGGEIRIFELVIERLVELGWRVPGIELNRAGRIKRDQWDAVADLLFCDTGTSVLRCNNEQGRVIGVFICGTIKEAKDACVPLARLMTTDDLAYVPPPYETTFGGRKFEIRDDMICANFLNAPLSEFDKLVELVDRYRQDKKKLQ